MSFSHQFMSIYHVSAPRAWHTRGKFQWQFIMACRSMSMDLQPNDRPIHAGFCARIINFHVASNTVPKTKCSGHPVRGQNESMLVTLLKHLSAQVQKVLIIICPPQSYIRCRCGIPPCGSPHGGGPASKFCTPSSYHQRYIRACTALIPARRQSLKTDPIP